jgi:transcriptional regulator with XRE-family HTH domain
LEPVNKNIRFLRENAGWTQRELAGKLQVKTPVIGSYEEGRSIPPVLMVLKIADLFKIDLEAILRLDISSNTKKFLKSRVTRGKEVLSITVTSDNEENVELVNHKAAAGYSNGYSDPEFIKELPKIQIPTLPRNHTYRGFEISGDSMIPVKPGDIIIGRYVENFEEIQNGGTYVILTQFQGIVYKRVYNFLDIGRLLLVSDNRLYDPYTIDVTEVRELWCFVARITFSEENIDAPSGKVLDFLATKLVEQLKNEK